MPKECAIYTHVVKKVAHVHNFLTIWKRCTTMHNAPKWNELLFYKFLD